MTAEVEQAEKEVRQTLGVGASGATTWRRWLRGMIVGLAGALLLLWWVMSWRDAGDEVRYETRPVTRGDITVTISATGTLQPTNTVDVGIEVSGTVASVEADYNQRVRVGDVLARLDPTKLHAQVLQSEAALAAAQAKVLQAQVNLEKARLESRRLQEVHAGGAGFVSEQDLDVAELAVRGAQAEHGSAEAAVKQTQATLESVKTDMAKAVIRSPINGVVLNRAVEVGQTVAASFQAPVLFSLAEDLAQMELQADIDEADVGSVNAGQAATFTVDAYPDRPFPAQVIQVRYGSQTVDGVVTYTAILRVDNTNLILRPGMTATAQIQVDSASDALLLPNAALRFSPPQTVSAKNSGSFINNLFPRPPLATSRAPMLAANAGDEVWVLRDGELVAIPLTLGLTDAQRSVILAGDLQAGDEVVVGALRGD